MSVELGSEYVKFNSDWRAQSIWRGNSWECSVPGDGSTFSLYVTRFFFKVLLLTFGDGVDLLLAVLPFKLSGVFIFET